MDSRSLSHQAASARARRRAPSKPTLGSSTTLTRMRVERDGEVLHRRVLNDALFCHRSPAATTRYIISHEGREEHHKSSGVWVGPAAGSTAAVPARRGTT